MIINVFVELLNYLMHKNVNKLFYIKIASFCDEKTMKCKWLNDFE